MRCRTFRAVELAPNNNHNAQLSLGRHWRRTAGRIRRCAITVRPPVSIRLTLRHSFASAWRSSISIVRQKLSRRSRKPFVCALNFAAAVFNLALTYYTLGRSDDARDQQRVLSEIDPNLARQLNSLLEGKTGS